MNQSAPDKRPKRPPRQIKAAAHILEKEAKRIVGKFAPRIAPEPLRRIVECAELSARQRSASEWAALEVTTEELDELLHQHASFARKGALRETLENVSVAILVALALRSCVYEPFKIPSGSMMPTLRAGDHIFVNKFVYGIQIPFTNTVVGESLGEIERGDVVVFRYPIDENEDFIKRVIGLPGDTIKVEGDVVSIRRAGEAEFEALVHRRLDEPCHDESGAKIVSGCALFEEDLDGRTHVVRYMTGDPRLGVQKRYGEWNVPAGHLLVMGDNRDQSHDSLAWTRRVEAVSADGLLTIKDLRDLTPERLFSLVRPDDPGTVRQDPGFDHITYIADHRAEARDLELEVWRRPTLGSAAIFDAHVAALPGARASTIAAEVAASPRYADAPNAGRPRERLLEFGEAIVGLAIAEDATSRHAVVHLDDAKSVIHLRCGLAACREPIDLIERLGAVLDVFADDPEQDARQLIEGEPGIRYSNHWTSRSSDRVAERTFTRIASSSDPAARVRLRIWREPDEGTAILRDAALRALGGPERAAAMPDLGADAWIVSDELQHAVVAADPAGVVFVLECGRQRCASATDAQALAATVQAKVPTIAKDRRALGDALAATEVGAGWREEPSAPRPRHEYDRTRKEGTERTIEHSVDLWVWRQPAQGLEAAIGELSRSYPGAEADDAIQPGGRYAALVDRQALIFAVPTSDVVVQIECRRELCADRETITAIGRRVADKARDTGNFVDPNAERPSPFVPRGNVKGRADRIWLPLQRFWLPIR